MFSIHFDRTSNIFVDVNVGAKNHIFNFPLILEKYNVMILLPKSKFIEEFTFAITVEFASKTTDA